MPPDGHTHGDGSHPEPVPAPAPQVGAGAHGGMIAERSAAQDAPGVGAGVLAVVDHDLAVDDGVGDAARLGDVAYAAGREVGDLVLADRPDGLLVEEHEVGGVAGSEQAAV